MDKEEFLSKAHRLSRDERPASALRVLLDGLGRFPGDEELLQQAALVIAINSTSSVQYNTLPAERLTRELMGDPRLDALFSECAQCHCSFISPAQVLGNVGASVSVTNPIGAYCSACELVFCRDCLGESGIGVTMATITCPRCHGPMDHLQKPNGRGSVQAPWFPDPLLCAALLREGPIPLDEQEAQDVLKEICPPVIQQQVPLHTGCTPFWERRKMMALDLLQQKEPDALQGEHWIDHTVAGYREDRFLLTRVFGKEAAGAGPQNTDGAAGELPAEEEDAGMVEEAEACVDPHRLFDIACRLVCAGNLTAGTRYLQRVALSGDPRASNRPLSAEVLQILQAAQRVDQLHKDALEGLSRRGPQRTLELLEQVREGMPGSAAAHSSVGWVLTLLKRHSEAQESLTRALSIDPFLPEAHNNQGMLYLLTIRPVEAREAFQRALELRPDYTDAKNNLHETEQALSRIAGG